MAAAIAEEVEAKATEPQDSREGLAGGWGRPEQGPHLAFMQSGALHWLLLQRREALALGAVAEAPRSIPIPQCCAGAVRGWPASLGNCSQRSHNSMTSFQSQA